MATSNGFLHSDSQPILPPWLTNSSNGSNVIIPPSPSVALTLSPSAVLAPSIPWMQRPERSAATDSGGGYALHHIQRNAIHGKEVPITSELAECFRELEDGHKAWIAHKKETAWRMKRLELQLESEKAARRREKMEEIESKVRALKEEQKVMLERIDAEYKEQILGLRRDAEAKEQKLVDHWTAKHLQMVKLLEQMGCRPRPGPDAGGR